MRAVSLEELKKLQIGILDVTAQFCEEHGIRYWLDSGTLLGAIRHNGYIPWDDDIDICMLRPDFDRFIREFNEYNPRYSVKCVDNDLSFTFPFAKVLDNSTVMYEPDETGKKFHINIDVFVYDNAPDDEKEISRMFRKRDFCWYANQLRTARSKPSGGFARRLLVRFLRLLVRPFPEYYFAKKEAENAKKYKDIQTDKVGNFLGWARAIFDKNLFDSLTEHVFEGKMYKIPANYDSCLTTVFGDYMKFPPKEEQVTHHTFKAYVSDEN